ncbi:hypothetical protein [Aequorivita lipolytica]|uniref:Anti-sigma factor n=1 Tax=Aequorivita lipolytica TaxID=153267 RepID=A0A5C6YV82_9FLAO|nr:hypothetical protein [Aequorivita lipolytica]TXD70865.1 hypothetical protein ESV24_01890 [Aequorivita lipolytica]SRX49918.1 hypothetical protein AEQU2_00383 [Aequorivita lipolytica]
MAPYKLEDNIREKLEAREVKPSADAWKKLEAKLDAAQPKKKPVLWYYVAASFVGFLILASVFFSRNNAEVSNPIVIENVEQPAIENETEIIPTNSETEKIASEENIIEETESTTSKKESEKKQKQNSVQLKPLPQKKSAIDKKIEKNEALAKISETEKQKSVKKENLIISDESSKTLAKVEEESLFNNKVDEVVASVKKLNENNQAVTVAEVEKLLNDARRDIQTQRILNNPKVDATALLQDVEWKVEKSFRDKVFDALGEGFNKIRTAVTERND